MRHTVASWTIVFTLVLVAQPGRAADLLPSWRETPTKHTILAFVASVTDAESDAYVDPADRIATFDNDGTLWLEKPLYLHLYAVFDRYHQLLRAQPDLASKQPYKAILARDRAYFVDLLEAGKVDLILTDLFGVPFEGMSPTAFADWNRRWIADWRHPRFQRRVEQLVYQPMVELIHYLAGHDFKVYLVTADEGAFLRLFSQELYGVARERVLGSSIELAFEAKDGKSGVVRTRGAHFLNNWDAKPRQIERVIGRRPILAAGNSNGDQQMLQFAAGGDGPSLSLLLHHTDDMREYAYESHTDQVLPLAKEQGWTIVDMKRDWRTVFPSAR